MTTQAHETDPYKFAEIWNDLKSYPKTSDVAEALGMTVVAVKSKARRLKMRYQKGHEVPFLISRHISLKEDEHRKEMELVEATKVPFSEDQSKITDPWTREQCIEELMRLVTAEPDRIITRNYFRVHSRIAESVWNHHFGTFEEFKRQAGVILSRHAHMHEKKIAIHASRDHYRAMSRERIEYADKYLRPNSNKYKTVVVGSDLHDREADPFYLRVFLDTIKRVKPDVVCLNGDIFDVPEFGHYTVDPRDWDAVGRIKFVHENILGPIRKASPDSQIDLIEGNHEGRLLKMLADATPALRAVLADLHGWTISKLLGLDEFQVNYIARCDLAAWRRADVNRELSKNYQIYWDVFVAHHFPYGRKLGMPGWNGHHHRHELWEGYSPTYGSFEWHQLGAGHRRRATYCEAEKWSNGFMIANCNVETKSTAMDYVQITDFAIVGGKFYERTQEEGYGVPAVWPGR